MALGAFTVEADPWNHLSIAWSFRRRLNQLAEVCSAVCLEKQTQLPVQQLDDCQPLANLSRSISLSAHPKQASVILWP